MEADRSTLILTFGVLAIFIPVCLIFGLIAWIMGKTDLEKIENGTMDPAGQARTQVGVILGKVGVALFFIGLLFVVLFGIGTFAFGTT